MRWKDRNESNNVEDRRGSRSVKTGGISIIGLIVAFVAWKFFGVNPQQAYQVTQQVTSQSSQNQQQPVQKPTQDQVEDKRFVSTVLADTEQTWTEIFKAQGKTYTPPILVLYTGTTSTACGSGQAAMGPFYCPADQKVYLDTTFFRDMRTKMGIGADHPQSTELNRQDQAGDFAMAYVIAHEVGHHVQNLLGVSKQVYRLRSQSDERTGNQLSVRQELQADCFSGVWAKRTHDRVQFLDDGDIAEAMDAAKKIGDDFLQKRATGQIVPDSFTHGTSQQRMDWFQRGFQSGDIARCDSFNTEI